MLPSNDREVVEERLDLLVLLKGFEDHILQLFALLHGRIKDSLFDPGMSPQF